MIKYPPKGLPRNNEIRVVSNDKKPLYIVEILDTSGSMGNTTTVYGEDGPKQIRKIDQLTLGVKKVIKSLQKFQNENVLYNVYLQIIQLNSYGRAVFPEFRPISGGFNEISFTAEGCTCLGNSLSTLKTFINTHYLQGCNRAVNVILMSDGKPTDVNGLETGESAYKSVIDNFKDYLRRQDYERSVDLYSIAVGEDADADMLRYFCGNESRFFSVSETESLADKLDFATRMSLAHHTYYGTDGVTEQPSENLEEIFPKGEPDIQKETKKSFSVDLWACKNYSCGKCIDNCTLQAISYKNGEICIDPVLCNGCGICAQTCPEHAIKESEEDELLQGRLGF